MSLSVEKLLPEEWWCAVFPTTYIILGREHSICVCPNALVSNLDLDWSLRYGTPRSDATQLASCRLSLNFNLSQSDCVTGALTSSSNVAARRAVREARMTALRLSSSCGTCEGACECGKSLSCGCVGSCGCTSKACGCVGDCSHGKKICGCSGLCSHAMECGCVIQCSC